MSLIPDLTAPQIRFLAKALSIVARKIPAVGDAVGLIMDALADELREVADDIDHSEAVGKASGEAAGRSSRATEGNMRGRK